MTRRELRYIVVMIIGIEIAGYAQMRVPGFPPGAWWKDRRLAEELRLTQDQQGKIEAIWVEHRRRLIDEKAELDKRQLDLSDILSKEQVDEAAAMKAFEQVQVARTALERTTFSMRIRTKNVLSPEQQQKLDEVAEKTRRERQAGSVAPKPSNTPR
jgi:Spy/CpxP family protein refolding chaperone